VDAHSARGSLNSVEPIRTHAADLVHDAKPRSQFEQTERGASTDRLA